MGRSLSFVVLLLAAAPTGDAEARQRDRYPVVGDRIVIVTQSRGEIEGEVVEVAGAGLRIESAGGVDLVPFLEVVRVRRSAPPETSAPVYALPAPRTSVPDGPSSPAYDAPSAPVAPSPEPPAPKLAPTGDPDSTAISPRAAPTGRPSTGAPLGAIGTGDPASATPDRSPYGSPSSIDAGAPPAPALPPTTVAARPMGPTPPTLAPSPNLEQYQLSRLLLIDNRDRWVGPAELGYPVQALSRRAGHAYEAVSGADGGDPLTIAEFVELADEQELTAVWKRRRSEANGKLVSGLLCGAAGHSVFATGAAILDAWATQGTVPGDVVPLAFPLMGGGIAALSVGIPVALSGGRWVRSLSGYDLRRVIDRRAAWDVARRYNHQLARELGLPEDDRLDQAPP